MRCPRCAGIRVPEMITDGGMRSLALRCVLCGDLTDHVIARNRQQPRFVTIKDGRARTPVYGRTPYKRDWSTFG